MMTLDEYLKSNCMTAATFAEMIDVNEATVFRIRTGRVFPHRKTMKAILAATNGAVTANDMLLQRERNETEKESE